MRGLIKNWDFKAAERQQNDGSSGWTTFKGLRFSKGSSLIKKTSGYKLEAIKKAFFCLHYVQDGQKDGR